MNEIVFPLIAIPIALAAGGGLGAFFGVKKATSSVPGLITLPVIIVGGLLAYKFLLKKSK